MDPKQALKATDSRPMNRGAPVDSARRYPVQVRATFVRLLRPSSGRAA
ncbi:MAG TPA: hypothetical protein VIH21_06910 [Dehalococcoidia bacterium]|jgi:hypothetical protein